MDAGLRRVGLYELGASDPVALTEVELPSGPVHLALGIRTLHLPVVGPSTERRRAFGLLFGLLLEID